MWERQGGRWPRDPRLGHRAGVAYEPIESATVRDLYTDTNGFVSLKSSTASAPILQGEKALVLILGGSAAMGYGASSNENTIAGQLHTLLSSKVPGNYMVINGACAAYCSWQELIKFSMELYRYKPEYVFSISSYNDFVHSSMGSKVTGEWILNHDRSIDDLASLLIDSADSLNSMRNLGFYFYHRLKQFEVVRKSIKILFNSLTRKKYNEKELLWGYESANFTVREFAADNYVSNMNQLYSLVSGYGGKFNVVIQPQPIIDYSIMHRDHMNAAQSDLHRLDRNHPNREIARRKFYDRLYNIIEPIHYFSRVNIDESLFIDHIHLNDGGNKEIANILHDRILSDNRRSKSNANN